MLVVLIGCFALIFLQLNNLQVRQAASLDASPHQPNPYGIMDAFALPRGDIITSDEHVMATEKSMSPKDSLGPLRVYPYGSLFTNITGYYDATAANSTGLEYEYNQYLEEHQIKADSLRGILTEQSGTDTVATTISYKLQQVAAAAMAPYSRGAVVAIDPRNGNILALYGKPIFNANGLASHRRKSADAFYKSLNPSSGSSALVNPVTNQTYNPGSTFKIVTTAAIYDHNSSIVSQIFPNQTALTIRGTALKLHNFGGESCGGDLPHILAVSCDTAYAKIGLELGAPSLAQEATAFGFDKTPPIDLPVNEIAESCFPPLENSPYSNPACFSRTEIVNNLSIPIGAGNLPFIAYSAIGQGNVTETALENALIVTGIANGGVIMTPHLMSAIIDSQGHVIMTYKPHPYLAATSHDTANQVRQLMLGVTASGGTGSGLPFLPDLRVAAKTGTAETLLTNCSSTWFVATAPAGPNDIPKIAVAAVIPAGAGIGCSETGAAIAGPIVTKVINAYLTN